ncbi:glycosyltransferase [Paraclostridium sp. AKS46]|nr:glycosyltransferase [Paraclostridium sp. AKS46]
MHVVFVILHYLTIDDTIECVESINNNIVYDNYSIVIVDNGSKNNTGEILLKTYENKKNIKVILNKENIGFAKGNNIGFRYAKHKLKADFIVMINNDTVINQKEFCKNIIELHSTNKFDIAGPKIISLVDNEMQNPVPVQFKSIKDVKIKIKKFYILLFLNYLKLDGILQYIKNKAIKKNDTPHEFLDFQLHGSCLIFSKKYINMYQGLNPNTFMYCEEDILKYISLRDRLKMTYSDSIEIYHKEDSATDEVFKKDRLKRRFYYKNSIDSCKVLIDLMNND